MSHVSSTCTPGPYFSLFNAYFSAALNFSCLSVNIFDMLAFNSGLCLQLVILFLDFRLDYSRKIPPPDRWGRFLTPPPFHLDFLKHKKPPPPLLSGFPRQKTPLLPGFPGKNIGLNFNIF